MDAGQGAISRWGTPAIFNTDQASQFKSDAFTTLLKCRGIRISMDGKGAWRDNIFVECLWHSIKCEEIYLKAYDSVRAARCGMDQYLQFYDSKSPPIGHMTKPLLMRRTLTHCRFHKCSRYRPKDLA